jgi:hypothetical protein
LSVHPYEAWRLLVTLGCTFCQLAIFFMCTCIQTHCNHSRHVGFVRLGKSLLFQQDATTCACSTSKLSKLHAKLHATCADCRKSSPLGGSGQLSTQGRCFCSGAYFAATSHLLKLPEQQRGHCRMSSQCSAAASSSTDPISLCRLSLTLHVQDMAQCVCC